MSGRTVYPLAPSAWGAAEEIPVDDAVQALLFSDCGEAFGTAYVDVALEPDPLTRGWRVLAGETIIGAVSAAHRGRFPAIERVHAAGITPVTTAGVRCDGGRMRADIFLPPPDFAVPRNNAPAGTVALPSGDMYVVDTSSGEFTAAELASRSPGQWLVGLTQVGEAVVATLDGRALGALDAQDSAFFRRILARRPVNSAFARAHIIEGMVGLDVAAPDGAWLQLPPIAPETARKNRPWTFNEFPDGTWAVTVPREYAVDPVERAAPSVDFTPTTSFRASSATYLTEAEKLRQLRAQDTGPRTGRHRR